MGEKRAAKATAVVVGAVAVVGGVWLAGQSGTTEPASAPLSSAPLSSAPPTSAPVPTRVVPGDGPPNHADNRGHLQPKKRTPEQQAVLDAEAQRLAPYLEALTPDERLSPEAVAAAVVSAGFPADNVAAVYRDTGLANSKRVVYGVLVPEGCVSGGVWVDQVQAVGVGPVAEWGCLPPDTH